MELREKREVMTKGKENIVGRGTSGKREKMIYIWELQVFQQS